MADKTSRESLEEIELLNQDRQDRIDNDDQGRLDDVVINNVVMFRMERMTEDSFWIRLYRKSEHGQDVVFNLSSKMDISKGKPAVIRLLGSYEFDGNAMYEEETEDAKKG